MIGDNVFFLNSVDSTNNYAMGRIHAGLAKHGDIYLAREQTAGKGQRGKDWLTVPGENITLSIVLCTKSLFLPAQFLLSVTAALAVSDLFTEKVNYDVQIKWPNDLYWRDRKAGGILIENIIKGSDWKYAVVGIGLNINQVSFPVELVNPVSVKQITGKHWDVNALSNELVAFFEIRWQQLLGGEAELLLDEYNKRLYKRGEKVSLKKDNIYFETLIREVNKEGEMITGEKGLQKFKSGEIQWVV